MNLDEVLNKYDKDNLIKLFTVNSVINEFPLYFGIGFDEMRNYFINYEVIDFEEVCNYLKNKNMDFVLSKRQNEYLYYNEVLSILSDKGLFFINLLEYLSNSKIFNLDDFYERQLMDLEIEHYSSVLIGNDIKRILIALFHIKKMFDENLENINKKELYLDERIDGFGFSYGGRDIYPSRNLIVTNGKVDKTSLAPRKVLFK